MQRRVSTRRKWSWRLLPLLLVGGLTVVASIFFHPTAQAAQLNLVVTSTGDNGGVNPAVGAGTGTLRQAIIDANAATTTADAPHNITFNIAGGGVQTIALSAKLPPITKPTYINGISQPGSSCGMLVPSLGAASNTPHTLNLAIDGSAVTLVSGVDNLIEFASTADSSQISGVSIYGAIGAGGNLISVNGAPNVKTECNYIGLKPDGTAATSNALYLLNYNGTGADNGIILNNAVAGATKNLSMMIRLNGTATGATNIQTNTVVRGNLIGVDPTGSASRNTGFTATGIYSQYADTTLVDSNVISGNTNTTNAAIYGTNSANVTVKANIIGASLSGQIAIPNGNGVYNAGGAGQGWIVGGSTAADRNYILGNSGQGFLPTGTAKAYGITIQNNYFGLAPDGTTVLKNDGHNINLSNFTVNPVVRDNVIVGAGTTVAAYGIYVITTGADIKGNLIGITPSGVTSPNRSGGIYLLNATDSIIGGQTIADRNIISGNATSTATAGIMLSGTTGVVIEGNYIGTDAGGTVRRPNGNGIVLNANNTNTRIGGALASQRNIISGNTTNGITVSSGTTPTSNIAIMGNYIGLDKNGDTLTGATGTGITLSAPNGIKIGGASTGEGNVISGNPIYGISFGGVVGQAVQVYGNIIGLKPDGETSAGNGLAGVYLVSNNNPTGVLQIGGASSGQGNIISGNPVTGIYMTNANMLTNPASVKGNKIGVTASGAAAGNGTSGIRFTGVSGVKGAVVGGIGAGEGNTIAYNTGNGIVLNGFSTNITVRGNAMHDNTGLGFAYGASAIPTPNDLPSDLDGDTGGNGLQNFPQRTTLTRCDASSAQATYLWSAANTTYTVDFYANPSGRDPTGYGEGEQYVSSATVTTNATGYASITPPAGITNMSMTATDPNGNTSEFSNERAVAISGCDITTKTTNDSTPSLSGTVSLSGFTAGATPTTTTISADSQGVSATISGSSWNLADNTLDPIADGVYDVSMTTTDPISKLQTTSTKTSALTIDTVQPTVSVSRKAGQTIYTQTNSAWFTATLSDAAATGTFTASDISLGTTTGTV